MTRACTAIGLARATAYRHLQPPPRRVSHPRRPSHRRLSHAERARVLEVLDFERFIVREHEFFSQFFAMPGPLAEARG